jgi:hypothetical protein
MESKTRRGSPSETPKPRTEQKPARARYERPTLQKRGALSKVVAQLAVSGRQPNLLVS